MELRSMFQNLFGRSETAPDTQQTTSFKMLNSFDNYFRPSSTDTYNDPTIRTCIDTIARQVARFQMHHIIRTDKGTEIVNDELEQLLAKRPNEYMSPYDFIYKLASLLYRDGNVFVYLRVDGSGLPIAMYPLSYSSVELRESSNLLFAKFEFANGKITVPYTDLIHIRRHYCTHDIYGDTSSSALDASLSALNSATSAMESAVKNSTKLRGIIKLSSTVRPEDARKVRDDFSEQFLNPSNATGLGVLDSKADYINLPAELKTIDSESMSFVRNDIYRFYGIPEEIVCGNFSVEQYRAFYEATLAPLALQLSQEFTSKIFTDKEKLDNHEVLFATDRLEFLSTDEKIQLIKVIQPAGVLTINEIRGVFGFNPIADGDKIQVSLNNVSLEDQSQYQLGKEE